MMLENPHKRAPDDGRPDYIFLIAPPPDMDYVEPEFQTTERIEPF